MQQPAYTNKYLRQRKSLLLLPVLIIPFTTMAFWAFGGGRGTAARAGQSTASTGLNLQLPNAHLKDDHAMDKMAYYDIAESDSERVRALVKNDPNLQQQLPVTEWPDSMYREETQTMTGKKQVDPNEEKVYQKLDQLNAVFNKNTAAAAQTSLAAAGPVQKQSGDAPALPVTPDQTRLQQLMEQMKSNTAVGQDTEMQQLSGMLEKILDIQHPQRVSERYQQNQSARTEQVYAVTSDRAVTNISLLDTPNGEHQNDSSQFLTLENKPTSDDHHNAIEAAVHETQTLVNGAVIKLRLLNDIDINGHALHKDNFIYGTAILNGERLVVTIQSIRDEHSIYPVKMEAYDMDGLAGIYVPGAISRDVAKQSTDNAIRSLALGALDPSVGAQAASAGIEMGKQLISKKVKLVKVQVKAGYKLLLKDVN